MEIYDCDKNGYNIMLSFGGWRVAYLKYAERFSNISYLERHMLTDEVFVLLEGTAELIIGKEMIPHQMEKNKIYNVPKGEWHNIKVSKDAKLLIVENSDTSKENSEYIELG